MRRFFIAPEFWGEDCISIIGQDAHHIRHVLRLGVGQVIIVFDGRGMEFRAQITAVDGDGVAVELKEPLANTAESALNLAVAQAYLKDKKMDQLVRQLTELGVRSWVPFLARRSVPAPDENRRQSRLERWQKISREAVKQCRRSRPMTIESIRSFQDALAYAQPYGLKLIFWENETAVLASALKQLSATNGIFVMVGPEGGFEDAEVSAARKTGFRCVGLGPRILRAETATLSVSAMLQYVFGDMG